MSKIGNFYDKYDLFAQEIPSLHIEGHKRLGSCIGYFLTVLLTTLVFVYGGSRSRFLITGERPNISSFTLQDARDAKQMINLNDHNFKVAFSVEAIKGHDISPANDPNYVEWVANVFSSESEST